MKFSTLPIAVLAAVAAADSFAPWETKLAHDDAILEQFDDSWDSRWKVSHAKRDGEFSYVGRWAVEEPNDVAIPGDKGLVAKSPASHHAISYIFNKPYDNTDKDLILQYEAKFQQDLNCGGAYIKLLSADGNLDEEFSNETPYQIMFGPDKCGSTNKVHFIIRRKNPHTGEYEEKHLRTSPMAKMTRLSSLYTLIIKQNNDFEIRINGEVAKAGNLLDGALFTPAFNPAKEIDDPNDVKPETWVDDIEIPDPEESDKPEDWDENAPRRIPDPEAVKPEDWDEDTPEYIPDPEAEKPEDWDDEEDGEWIAAEIPNPECEEHGCGKWEAPIIENPNYKGKWIQPMIPNPDYKGPWAPRKIENPDYYEDTEAHNLEPIGGLGFELWTMDKNLLFDNIYLGHSVSEAELIGNKTFAEKLQIEKLHQEESVQVDEAPNVSDEAEEATIIDQLSLIYQIAFESGKSFLKDANDYMVDLVEDPVYVLTERRNEALIYGGVFGFTFSVFFGTLAILLLKLTSEIDDSVDAKSNKEVETEKKDEKEDKEDIEEEKEAKTSSSEQSETKAEKRR
ncbi:calnexin [Saccharomycopsis crataegensis]|uniref:Calnexin n=1 Tax=Saccharomycopsis crataegensis TaxID=43959 RepID=A0AAV5QGM9_9ASCO|nr:calnexin [Saccharomycopsis crataegensis]